MSEESESKALVLHPTESVAADEERHADEMAFRGLKGKQRAFLRAYIAEEDLHAASEKAGCSVSAHKKWLMIGEPGYAEAYEVAKDIVTAKSKRRVFERQRDGLTERIYDGKGELLQFKVRQDSSLIRAYMASIAPEEWGNNSERGTTAVQVNVVFKDE